MSIVAKQGSNEDFVQPKTGLTTCIVQSVIDCGTQPDDKFGPKRKIMIVLALPKQTHIFEEGEAPEMLTISKWFTLSTHKKGNLKPFVEGITGQVLTGDYDVTELLGINCMAHLVEHIKDNGDKKVVIASTSPLMDGQEPIAIKTSKFSFDDFDLAEFQALSERMQERLKVTPEYKAQIADNPY